MTATYRRDAEDIQAVAIGRPTAEAAKRMVTEYYDAKPGVFKRQLETMSIDDLLSLSGDLHAMAEYARREAHLHHLGNQQTVRELSQR